MKNNLVMMFAMLGGLLFSGCEVAIPPIESCIIVDDVAGSDTTNRTQVFPTQLKPLSLWFAAVSNDWKFELTDTPRSGMLLNLKDKHGRITRANLRGDRLWIRNRYKVLSLPEREELLAIINVNRMPVFGNQ